MPRATGRLLVSALFLLWLCASASAQNDVPFEITPVPGSYGSNTRVELKPDGKPGGGPAYGAYEYRFSGSEESGFSTYSEPIRLTALPGEERSFTLEIRRISEADAEESTETHRVHYVIDKRPPLPPDLNARHSDDSLNLQIGTPSAEDEKSELRFYYWTSLTSERASRRSGDRSGVRSGDRFGNSGNSGNSGNRSPAAELTGPSRTFRALGEEQSLRIPWPNDIFACDIAVYAEDRHGNRSELVEQTVTRDTYLPACDDTLRVMSPVEGRFANPQWLVIASTDCFDWIRYSIDGSDPVDEGVEYHQAMLLRVRGDFTLRVAAKRSHDGEILRKNRDFSVRNEAPDLSLSLPEHVKGPKPEIEEPKAEGYRFFYSFEERIVDQDDRSFDEAIRLDMSSPTFHGVPLRVAALHEETGELYQYRYFYHFDNRKPAAPIVVVSGKTPFRESVKVYLFSRKSDDIYYTVDGSTPDRFSREYSGPLTITPPGGADAGSVTLRAIARSKNGRTSETSSRVLLYDNDEPSKPEILIDQSGSRRLTLRIKAPEETEKLRYELRYGKDATGDFEVLSSSPTGKRRMVLEFPRGYAGRAVIRAAAEDDAGNISAPSEPVSFYSDTVPPPVPKIRIHADAASGESSSREKGIDSGMQRRVEIEGSGNAGIRYAVISTATPGEEIEADETELGFREYEGAFVLSNSSETPVSEEGGDAGAAPDAMSAVDSEGKDPYRAYRILAFAVDEEGNRSATAESSRVVLDGRRAEEVIYSGIEDDGHYRSARVLHIQSPQRGSVIHYRVDERERPPEEGEEQADEAGRPEGEQATELPDRDSPVAEGPILFNVEEGEETGYEVSARSYIPAADSWSEARTLRFTMDRRAPETPRIVSPADGGIYSSPVSVEVGNVAEDEQVWLLSGAPGEFSSAELSAEEIRNKGVPLQPSLSIGPEEGAAKDYVLYAAVFDRAGNSARAASQVEFTVDRDPPGLVQLTGIPESGVATGPVVISRRTEEEEKRRGPDLVYRISTGDQEPAVPGRDASVLTLPFTVHPEEGTLTEYTMLYRSIDEAGNVSKEVGRLVFSIDDREVPPPEIRVDASRSNAIRLTLIAPDEDFSLSYGIDGEPDTGYEGPVILDPTKQTAGKEGENGTLRISARAESSSGKLSRIARKELRVEQSPSAYVSGLENRAVYNRDLTVEPTQEAGESIRYELTAIPQDGIEPDGVYPMVSAFSPELNNDITLSVAEGRTVHYLLSVGEVDPESGERIHSEEFFLTIDKSDPKPPRISGTGDKSYFTEIPEISLTTERNVRAFVNVSREGEESDTFREASGTLELQTAAGEIHSYTIRAYTVDEAGNRSETITKKLTVDRAVVYVAPNGNDANPGSRTEPFASLERALYETRSTERSTIYLASGTYTLTEPVELIESGLTIRGGFSHHSWKSDGTETLVRAAEDFPDNSPLFELRNGRFSCADLILTNSSLSASLIRQRGRNSEIEMERTKLIHSERANASLLELSDGECRVRTSSIELGPVSNGDVIRLNDARFLFEESEIAGGTSDNELRLIHAERGTVHLKNSTIAPGSAGEITAVFSDGGHVEISGTKLHSGRGSARSYALRLFGGSCNISNSEMRSHADSRLSFGISSRDCVIDIRNSSLNLAAVSGTVAIDARNGRIDLRSTDVESASTSEFIYLLRGDSSEMNILETNLKAGESSDVTALEARDADVMMKESVLRLSSRSDSIRGVSLVKSTILDLIDNDIAFVDFQGDGSGSGDADTSTSTSSPAPASRTIPSSTTTSAVTAGDFAAVEEKAASDLLLRRNRFYGVGTILITAEGEHRRSVEELEKERPPFDVKNPHSDNRIVPLSEMDLQ